MDMDTDAEDELIHAGIDAKTADWPGPIREQDPGRDASAERRARWFRQNRETAEAFLESEGEEGPDSVESFVEDANERRSALA